MTKITDMLGQEVFVGDRIASSFRCLYGTAAELRVGTVEDIVFRRSSQRNGSSGAKELHLRVRWDASSQDVETKQGVEKLLQKREERTGQPQPRPPKLDQEYRKRTSDIMVSLQRFAKIG
jgi:hypothetical protein